MLLRVVHGLGGLVIAYGSAYGPRPNNLMFDLGLVMLVLAAVVGWRAEHSLRGAWPALVTFCGFFAVLGVQTFGLPDCGTFTDVAPGAVACLAAPNSRVITLCAIVGLGVAFVGGALDVRRSRRAPA